MANFFKSLFKQSDLEPAKPAIPAPELTQAAPSPQVATTQSIPPSAQEPDATIIRKARIQDARNIYDLVNSLSGDGTLLRRNYAELCENIRDFTIAERLIPAPPLEENHPLGIYAQPPDDRYEFLGCGALHLYGPHLAEVRSIVVKPEAKGLGAGGQLIHALLEEAADHSIMSVCLFTRIPEFFDHFGFRVANREAMPDKIYKDCQTCPRLYACDEVAMVRGPLPNIAVLGPSKIQRPELIQIGQLATTGTGR
jgi:amino-acid N-acetyltransferase